MNSDAALRELLDRQAITDLIHAYCRHFDMNEPAALAGLFTADASVDYGPEFADLHGREAIERAVANGLATLFAATSHHVSNIRITFDGPDAAHGDCYLYAWHRYRDGRPESELWGRYQHRFVRDTDGWRIADLVLQAAGARDFHRSVMHPIGRRD
ncbi:MAG: nuclear transport factor 2 family protein [Geminicoccaceae bacterium]